MSQNDLEDQAKLLAKEILVSILPLLQAEYDKMILEATERLGTDCPPEELECFLAGAQFGFWRVAGAVYNLGVRQGFDTARLLQQIKDSGEQTIH